VQTFWNSDNVIIDSNVNGFLGQTLAGSLNNGGTAFSQMFPLNASVDTILSNPYTAANNNGSADPTQDKNANALAQALRQTNVGTLNNPCFVPGFYAASAVGPTIVATAGISSETAAVFPAFSETLAGFGPAIATGTSWLSRAGQLGRKVVGTVAGAAADAISSVCR
jgi:hypothetical protein